jgi:hypothetical protein
MKKTTWLAGALALAVVAWPHGRTGAALRCYPTERFKVLDDQSVRDTLTKLVWQRQASATSMNWADAKTYCANAGLRLPTVKELLSIVDLTVPSPGPTIDQKAFPSTPASYFWTSSPYAGSSGDAWGVYFFNGYSGYVGVGNSDRVRCVR